VTAAAGRRDETGMVSATLQASVTPVQPGVLRDVVSLLKPRVTLLVVFTMGTGMVLGRGSVGGLRAVLALLGCVLLVASANALNCYLERASDGFMERTRLRPLPAGRLHAGWALGVGSVLAVLSVPLLYWAANPLTAWLGVFSHVVYVGAYTPLKRVTAWSTVIGFVPGAMPPLMGYTTMTGSLDATGAMLFLVLFTWQLPHTLAIGLFRGKEYAAAGVRVIPHALGEVAAARQVAWTTLALVPVTLSFPVLGAAGWLYTAVACVLGGMFVRRAWPGLRGDAVDMRWARGVFFFSMGYLTLVLAALGLDRIILG
jgi:protoheme IX farnesyltransferase